MESLRQLAGVLEVRLADLADVVGNPEDEKGTANLKGRTVPEDSEPIVDVRVLDAARRLTETLTDGWRNGQFSSLDSLRSTAREIGSAYPDVGRGYIEAWLDLFKHET